MRGKDLARCRVPYLSLRKVSCHGWTAVAKALLAVLANVRRVGALTRIEGGTTIPVCICRHFVPENLTPDK